MTNKPLSLLISTALASVIYFVSASSALAAPRIFIDSGNVSVKKDQEFTIPIKIDVESSSVVGSDLTLNYAGEDLDILGVDNSNFFSEFTWANNTVGKLEIHAFTTSIFQGKTGSGSLANIKFKAKKDSGSSTLTFNCNGAYDDTNIISTAGSNILNCSNLNQILISYESSSTTSPSPSPSTSPSPTNPANSNSQAPVCSSLSINPKTSDKLPQSVTLACAGSDSDSSITSAEFNFGDGTTQNVTSDIGRSGTISTTHTYTKSGSFKPTCKLGDGKNAAALCSASLSITLKSTPKPTAKPKASTTPQLSTLVLDSPTPSESPKISIQTEEASEKADVGNWWLLPLILVIIGLSAALYIWRLIPKDSPNVES